MNQSFGSCYDPHLSSIFFLLLIIATSNMIDAQGQTSLIDIEDHCILTKIP